VSDLWWYVPLSHSTCTPSKVDLQSLQVSVIPSPTAPSSQIPRGDKWRDILEKELAAIKWSSIANVSSYAMG
jgi:hypothetical protein